MPRYFRISRSRGNPTTKTVYCCAFVSLPRSYLLQEKVFVGLHAHCMLVLAADLIEEPVQCVVVALGVLHQAVPQDVHLLQTQPCETETHTRNYTRELRQM